MSDKIEITVNQAPVDVSFDCPFCDTRVEIKYKEFCGLAGEPCDWTYSKIDCPDCGESLEISGSDWD